MLQEKAIHAEVSCCDGLKMQECNRCKAAGFPNQFIGFEKVGKHSTTGKISWKLIDENGVGHKHKFVQDLPIDKTPATTSFRRRRVVDVAQLLRSRSKKLLASS